MFEKYRTLPHHGIVLDYTIDIIASRFNRTGLHHRLYWTTPRVVPDYTSCRTGLHHRFSLFLTKTIETEKEIENPSRACALSSIFISYISTTLLAAGSAWRINGRRTTSADGSAERPTRSLWMREASARLSYSPTRLYGP